MVPVSGLPAARRCDAVLDAVIGGIADHVGQRILDHLQNLAVQLGFGALHDQFDLLAGFHRQIADDARQLVPGIADRLHAHARDAVLQVGGDVAEALQRNLEIIVLLRALHLQQLVAGQHQLADQRHQIFDRHRH